MNNEQTILDTENVNNKVVEKEENKNENSLITDDVPDPVEFYYSRFKKIPKLLRNPRILTNLTFRQWRHTQTLMKDLRHPRNFTLEIPKIKFLPTDLNARYVKADGKSGNYVKSKMKFDFGNDRKESVTIKSPTILFPYGYADNDVKGEIVRSMAGYLNLSNPQHHHFFALIEEIYASAAIFMLQEPTVWGIKTGKVENFDENNPQHVEWFNIALSSINRPERYPVKDGSFDMDSEMRIYYFNPLDFDPENITSAFDGSNKEGKKKMTKSEMEVKFLTAITEKNPDGYASCSQQQLLDYCANRLEDEENGKKRYGTSQKGYEAQVDLLFTGLTKSGTNISLSAKTTVVYISRTFESPKRNNRGNKEAAKMSKEEAKLEDLSREIETILSYKNSEEKKDKAKLVTLNNQPQTQQPNEIDQKINNYMNNYNSNSNTETFKPLNLNAPYQPPQNQFQSQQITQQNDNHVQQQNFNFPVTPNPVVNQQGFVDPINQQIDSKNFHNQQFLNQPQNFYQAPQDKNQMFNANYVQNYQQTNIQPQNNQFVPQSAPQSQPLQQMQYQNFNPAYQAQAGTVFNR